MRENLHLQPLHSNDVRRGSRSSAALPSKHSSLELGVARSTDDTDSKSSSDEEKSEAEIHSLEGGFDVGSWPFGFGRDHGDVLGPDDGEASAPEGGEEALETT